jgi:FMN-dependent oxidoreductase (nitrilotriacetate monooxygenase family)
MSPAYVSPAGPQRQMHLNAFLLGVGHHEAAWRLPSAIPVAVLDAEHYRHLARVAERGTFDSVFLADKLSIGHNIRHNAVSLLEPTVLLANMAAATDRIGLIATVSTSFNEPYNLARRLSSLDHISGGRAGWNIVTSYTDDEARNFGADHLESHDLRYRRAEEFVGLVRALWDSWEDGAFVHDKSSGVFADSTAVHDVGHAGEFYQVHGALTLPRSPQGHPLLVQAGASEAGRSFAAEHADAVFTAHQYASDARAFYGDVKARAAAAGRDPDHVKILPGLVPVLGSTEAAARRLADELGSLIVSDYAVRQLSNLLETDLTGRPLDALLPPLPPVEEINGNKSRYALIAGMAERESLTIRQVLARLAGGRGHWELVGTPEQIADVMATWFTTGAADGFNVMPPQLPTGLETFVERVVPELRKRGLFRVGYTAHTLRGHYGIPRPQEVRSIA